jgi:hypothetical protein
MALSPDEIAYLSSHHAAAMITVAADGVAKIARVGIALVDGRLWSSGTQNRVRTRRLRQDARATLFVFDETPRWLALETTVIILDGPDAPALNLRLFRELDEAAFLEKMVAEQRLVYEFDVTRSYGVT